MRQRDKSNLPLPNLSYKYFLRRYSFFTSPFYRPKSTFLAVALPEDSKNFNKGLSSPTPKSSIFFLARRWPSTSLFLRSAYHPFSFRTFTVLLFICDSFFWIFLFPFVLPFILKNFQDLADKIVIPTDQPDLQCLGPLGNPDPTDLINAETNRIHFRAENISLDLWKDAFRSWPSPTKGWKDWFLRVSHSNEVQWGERKLDRCIRLSLADMEKRVTANCCLIFLVRHTQCFCVCPWPGFSHTCRCTYAHRLRYIYCR